MGEAKEKRIAARRRRLHDVVLLFAFVLVVLILLFVNIFTKDREFSETENRNLSQMPKLTLSTLADGSYFSDLTDYYNDQFAGRDRWISLDLAEMKVLGRQESGGVYLGSDGYLLSAPETPDEDSLEKTVEAINQFSEAHTDIAMQMMLVPDAATILSERLPNYAPVRDQLADIAAVEAQIDSAVEILDASLTLQSHADEEIYYKTDHHWTSLGAYYVFLDNAAALGITELEPYTVYTVADDFEGTLSSKSGSHADTDSVQIYTAQDSDIAYYVIRSGSTDRICSIYDSSALENKDKYTVFFGGNYSKVEICTTANNGRNLLVLKDSYANSFIQFLLPYYENIVMIDPRYYYDSLESVLLEYNITDVFYLYSADTFLTDTSLADVLDFAPQSGAEKAEEAAEEAEKAEDAEDAEDVENVEDTEDVEDTVEAEAEASDPDSAEETEKPEISEQPAEDAQLPDEEEFDETEQIDSEPSAEQSSSPVHNLIDATDTDVSAENAP